jgi:uncharacterized damage-inducible protein DinB
MNKQQILQELQSSHEFFNRSTRNLAEEHSTFAPAEGQMTACQQVAHVAQTIDWFFEGAFRPEGFSTDWDEMAKAVSAVTSLAAAREWVERSFAAAKAKAEATSDAEWSAALPPNMIFGEAPRFAIIGGLVDHTAHHRGALTVYARLKGVTPPMPYMDM